MTKFLTLLFLTITISSFSQILKVKNGISFSSLELTESPADISEAEFLGENITTYSFIVGLDYFEKKWFYLSSEIGYLKKGGEQNIEIFPNNGTENIKESWGYLHLNTTARLPIRLKNHAHFYMGAGPTFDVLIDSDTFESSFYEGHVLNSTIFGLKGEVGFAMDFKKIRVGLNASYLYDIDNLGGTESLEYKNQAYQIMLSLGYRL